MIIYHFIFIMAIWSFLTTFLLDPGYVDKNTIFEDQ